MKGNKARCPKFLLGLDGNDLVEVEIVHQARHGRAWVSFLDENEKIQDTIVNYWDLLPIEAEMPRCSNCGVDVDNSVDGYLFDIRIIVAHGEEGFADVTKLLCGLDTCLQHDLELLKEAGYVDHRHGGINFLEHDEEVCGGYGKCETPTEYGRVYVGNYFMNEY